MTFCYLDTETLGLNLELHDIWEIAWAIGDGEIQSGIVPHSREHYEPKALEVNGYWSRMDMAIKKPEDLSTEFEDHFYDTLQAHRRSGDAVTIVGAVPGFDTIRLARRWKSEPWHYRMIDIGSYAMPWARTTYPLGMRELYLRSVNAGLDMPQPDHTAAGDVAALRWLHKHLMSFYVDGYV